MLGYDPLPPLDTIYSYVRPERYLLLCSFAHTAPRSVLGLGGSYCLRLKPSENTVIWGHGSAVAGRVFSLICPSKAVSLSGSGASGGDRVGNSCRIRE